MSSEDIDRLPEPAELRSALRDGPGLDWESVPTAAEIARQHGQVEAAAALRRLAEVVALEAAVTADVLGSMPAECTAHELDHRVKSPQSLARKLATERRSAVRRPDRAVEDVNDVLRYTMLTPAADDLVAQTKALVGRLEDRGWSVVDAHHSYLDGSRYRGLHADLRAPQGTTVEIQFHSAPSAAVKQATTKLYEVNRDRHRARGCERMRG